MDIGPEISSRLLDIVLEIHQAWDIQQALGYSAWDTSGLRYAAGSRISCLRYAAGSRISCLMYAAGCWISGLGYAAGSWVSCLMYAAGCWVSGLIRIKLLHMLGYFYVSGVRQEEVIGCQVRCAVLSSVWGRGLFDSGSVRVLRLCCMRRLFITCDTRESSKFWDASSEIRSDILCANCDTPDIPWYQVWNRKR
jgi:hypothetical protein